MSLIATCLPLSATDSVGTVELNAQACELWPTGAKAMMDPEAQIPWNKFCKVGLN